MNLFTNINKKITCLAMAVTSGKWLLTQHAMSVIKELMTMAGRHSTDRQKPDQLLRKNYRTKDTFFILTKQNTILDKYRLHRR
jgi:hypothetical protein